MASRRHLNDHGCSSHQNHHDSIPLLAGISTTSSRCCTYGGSIPCCNQSNHPSPPQPPLDNLLHLVASYLQNQQQQEKPCPVQTCSCETPPQGFGGVRLQHRVLHQKKNVPREYDNIVLSCLLRKIEDLESSLNQFSASHDQRRDRYSTLRDSAARVIQTHFRSYLVRRSISFRHLKELAAIKSSFLSLKSSVSGKPHFPFKAVSQKATDLLLQLDSIQGGVDPMIRNSKRSLSRELVRFLQYIDDCAIKRFDLVSKSAVNVRFMGSSSSKKPQGSGVGDDRRVQKLRNRMGKVFVTSREDEDDNAELEELDSMTDDDSEEVSLSSMDKRKIGSSKSRNGDLMKGNSVKPPIRKSMVFDKKGNVYQVNGNTHDLFSSAEDDSVDEEIIVMSKGNGTRHSLKTKKGVLVKGSGGKTRVVKTVSFDENGNICKVYGDTPESSVNEEDDSTNGSNDGNGDEKGYGNEVEEIKYVPKENEGFEEEEEEEGEEGTHSENEVSSSEGSEVEAIDTKNSNHPEKNEPKKEIQHQKGSLMYSPPMPLKMEP